VVSGTVVYVYTGSGVLSSHPLVVSGAKFKNPFSRIRSDHNTDRTIELLEKWIAQVKDQYHMISTEFVKDQELYPDERGPAHWTKERFDHVISLRESALNFARKIWADYFLVCEFFD
jgi:hypothetical protein